MRLFFRYAFQIIFGALAFLFFVNGVIDLVAADWHAATQLLLCAALFIGAVWFFAQLWPSTNEMASWTPTLSDRAAKVTGCLSLAAMFFYAGYVIYVEDPLHRNSKTKTLVAIFGIETVASFAVIFGLFCLYAAFRVMFEPNKK